MELKRKYFSGAIVKDDTLGDRQIRVVLSTATPDRVKDVMEPGGCDLTNYLRNPIVLADHNTKSPIGTAQVFIMADRVEEVITFAPAGISAKADEYCGLAKAGILNTVSPGFRELEVAPLPGGGVHIKRWELLESSLVAVPAQPDAVVIGRSLEQANWKVGASRNLPVGAGEGWNGPAAAKGIFEKAEFEGDCPDSNFARKGFLVYDAANPDNENAYRVPFAKLNADGRLTVTPESIVDAAVQLKSLFNLPDDVADKARAVIAHYEGEMKKDKAGDVTTKERKFFKTKDLYDAERLASVVQNLVWLAMGADWERDYEEDQSDLPELLAGIARDAGAALVAMTAEEVAELVASLAHLTSEQKAFVGEGKSPTLKALRAVGIETKAGAKFSAATKKSMTDACKGILAGHDAIKALFDDPDSDDTSVDDQTAEADTAKALPPGVLSERERELDLLKLKSC